MKKCFFIICLFLLSSTTIMTPEDIEQGAFYKMLNNHAVGSAAKYAAEQGCQSVGSTLSEIEPEEGNPSAYIATCGNGTRLRISSSMQRQ